MGFRDVSDKHWAKAVIEAAAAAGWVGGFEDGTFRPDEPVTRAQAVSMIGRATVYMHNRLQTIISQCKPAVVMVTADGSLGAGSIITPAGHILTNEHVALDQVTRQPRPNLQVWVLTNPDGYEQAEAYPATVVATANWDDLALLKIDASDLQTLPLAAATPPEGTAVVAMGHPRGYQYTSSAGIITQDKAAMSGMFERIQTDAAINPGNSGGPIVDLQGRIVAVTQAKVQDSDNLAFGVRVEDVRTFVGKHLPDLIK